MNRQRPITGSIQPKGGYWYTVINLYDENGKRRQKAANTGLKERGNKTKAEAILREQLAEYNKNNITTSRLTVAEYFSRWIVDVKNEVRQNTYRTYLGNMARHIIPYFQENKILLYELTANDLEAFYKCKAGEVSATTIHHFRENISKALTDAMRAGLINSNPAALARTPKCEQYKAKFLNPEEIQQLLKLYKGTKIELPVQLCVVYGLRRSEVLGLKWQYIDFSNRQFRIAETLQQNTGGNYTDAPKTSSSYRTLPMTDEVYHLLLDKRKSQNENRELLKSGYKESDYVCTHSDGTAISPNYLTKEFHKIIKTSDLPQIRLHDLRHSTASNLLASGFSIPQVQEWLGHGSATTTMKYYAHADKTSKLGIASALQGVLNIKDGESIEQLLSVQKQNIEH